MPLGASFSGVAPVHTEADIFVDLAPLLEDVDMWLDTVVVEVVHSFELLGRSARIDVTQA